MIKVKVLKNNDEIDQIIISGHSNYDRYGKDIVCAAVSSIVITTINAIISINDQAVDAEINDKTVIRIVSKDNITNKLIENMLNLLEELEMDYPSNIKFE